ncbi:hypothetical protein BA6E_121157 [Bacteroidales bacterium 6E]|nr:hypothetical protein BA6E_121157 [Bacteroidales bacterium 6E]
MEKSKWIQLVNSLYTLMTLALLALIVNYFGNFVMVPQSVIVVVLVISAILFFLRMYLRFSRRI